MMEKSQIDKLMELKQLYEQGILTKEEMEIEKKKILLEDVSKGEQQPCVPSIQEHLNPNVYSTKESSNTKGKEVPFFQKFKTYIFVGIGILITGLIYLFYSSVIKKESPKPPTPAEVIRKIDSELEDDIGIQTNSELSKFEELLRDCNWIEENEGFKYPNFFKHHWASLEEIPADVEIYTYGSVDLCYWPSLGVWSVADEFPSEGLYLSPTETVKNVTYRADSKGIASGYTNSGKIYYLKQKIMHGEGVDHSKFLVLINPPEYNKAVEKITNMVAKW